MEEKRLVIIDSHSLLYRAFHALPPLANAKGQPTGAVYGFLLTLFKAVKDLKANCIVACFDTKKPTFRHQDFKEYKIHRPEMPKDIVPQIAMLKEVLTAFEIPLFEKDGFEADDLIATIVEKNRKENLEMYVLSGDLDNLQLIDEKTKVYTLGKGIKDSVVYDRQKVIERFGVDPGKMNDFKALTGDVSDNVPGVPGIGKKTAADLIKEFGSVENLYSEISTNTALLKPKVKEALVNNKDKAFLSLQLVKAKKDVPIDFDLKSCQFGSFNQEKVKFVFNQLGFNSLVDRLSTIVF